MKSFPTQARALLTSARFQAAKKELIAAIAAAGKEVRAVEPAATDPETRKAYQELLQQFNKQRGRDLYFPFVAAGLGAGPYVELLDGSVKLDLITGIGINFFGHAHPELIGEMIDALPADLMQGNLEPGVEAPALVDALLSRVSGSRLAHAWLTTCGTMANEIALKIIRQKKAPATRVFAFEDCFSGRSTAMQEITDNPGYRQGQPVYGEVVHLPFYDEKLGLEPSVERTLGRMREELHRHPGRFAALMMELIQGEGGFRFAPREYYVRVFTEARKAGLAVWLDEIQTFGRTGELFAFQTFELHEFVDVVTAAKMLQASAVLFTDEYNPKPGLVAGTFSGSAAQLRAARRTLELLDAGFFGKEGGIARLSKRFADGLQKIRATSGHIGEIRAIGGMIAFVPHSGTQDEVKRVLMKLFDLGVVAFYCGHGPFLIRLLPPLGAMTEADVDFALAKIAEAL